MFWLSFIFCFLRVYPTLVYRFKQQEQLIVYICDFLNLQYDKSHAPSYKGDFLFLAKY
jgi:hypothetical protein